MDIKPLFASIEDQDEETNDFVDTEKLVFYENKEDVKDMDEDDDRLYFEAP